MGNKLFVGGLSYSTTDEALRQGFERFGSLTEAKVIMDRDTGRSRGFGFVTYEAPESAARALSEMNGAELDGRTIRVSEAENRDGRNDRGARGGPRGRRPSRGSDQF